MEEGSYGLEQMTYADDRRRGAPLASTIGPEPNRPKVRLATVASGLGKERSSDALDEVEGRQLVPGDRPQRRLRR